MPRQNDVVLSTRDYEMYYGNCIVQFRDEPLEFRGFYDDGERFTLHKENGEAITKPTRLLNELNTELPLLGYFQHGKTAVYVSNRQNRDYKKGLRKNGLEQFFPQQEEYLRMHRHIDRLSSFKMFKRDTTKLSGLDDALTTLDAVVLHRNYAVVKKATHKHPVLYYRCVPVGLYKDGSFVPLHEGTEVYVDKLQMEVSE